MPEGNQATVEMQIFNNLMRVVTKTMNGHQEAFMKMLEDRDTSQRHNEVVGENAEHR